MKKGETFNVSVVAVDQVNHSVDAFIISSLTFPDGGFGEGQQMQRVGVNCTNLRYNVLGVLYGFCQQNLSLSPGSSRCFLCHSQMPAVLAVIILVAILAGILLVSVILFLNITVAVGLINTFIFYANIVAISSAVSFLSSEPSFSTVFVAWLNLEIGLDFCLFDGLDAYTRIWIQLSFPLYIMSLVGIIIKISEHSPRFVRLIGKRDPVATLATLILLSYAKLLSVTITALSFGDLHYPDGSKKRAWLPDGNADYLIGKHIGLVIAAMFIIVTGVPYIVLLFIWQWLIRAPRWKALKWTRNTKLNIFIATYHAPHNYKQHYWTGLLLLVRIVLYVTGSVTTADNPQTLPFVTIVLVGCLFLLKAIIGVRVYQKILIDTVDTVVQFNLLIFTACSLYSFKTDNAKQTAVAYASTIASFILLSVMVIYCVNLLIKKDKFFTCIETDVHTLATPQPTKPTEVTHSIIEIPKPNEITAAVSS